MNRVGVSQEPGAALLGEAADWMVRLGGGPADPREHEAFARWGRQSAAHAEAWRRATSVQSLFAQVPEGVGGDALRRVRPRGRRQALQLLATVALAAPPAWWLWREQPWQDWAADLRTATGEQRRLTLADGTTVVLNTATALDVRFDAEWRRLWLHAGEILLTTGHDALPASLARPFVVQAPQGTARALGTRFTVRREADSLRVAVYEGAVELRSAATGQTRIVPAGMQGAIGPAGLGAEAPADPAALMWEHGMVVAKDMRLDALVAELSRYRGGVLRCDPAVGALRVSGAFPLRDTDASLALLAKTLPVRIGGITRYWTVVEAR